MARSVGSFAFGFLKLAPRAAAKPADLAARCAEAAQGNTAQGLALVSGLGGEKPHASLRKVNRAFTAAIGCKRHTPVVSGASIVLDPES